MARYDVICATRLTSCLRSFALLLSITIGLSLCLSPTIAGTLSRTVSVFRTTGRGNYLGIAPVAAYNYLASGIDSCARSALTTVKYRRRLSAITQRSARYLVVEGPKGNLLSFSLSSANLRFDSKNTSICFEQFRIV